MPILKISSDDDLGLSSEYLSFSTPNFNVKLVTASQTLASLSPKINTSFDFSPFDLLSKRSANGNYHIGDIVVRYRSTGQSWTNINTATKRSPVISFKENDNATLAISNLSPTLPSNIPLNITRAWGTTSSGDLSLTFHLHNTASHSLEIGGLGFPIEFNSIFTTRTAAETEAKCSLTDPNIGLSGGYLRVTPLAGAGASLVVTPIDANTTFEGWRFLTEDTNTALGYQSQTFEGFYSWEVKTLGYVEQEWNATTPWNEGTSKVLAAGEEVLYGLRFSVAENIREIEDAVKETGNPLAIGVPGYIIPSDMTAKLYLQYNSSVSTISTSPPNAINFTLLAPGIYTLTSSSSTFGRVRVLVTYTNNVTHSISYYLTAPLPLTISQLGNFLATKQHFTNASDPFHRGPSIITYDRSVNAPVLQDQRVWIAGLSDEGGAGSWLAAAMKISAQPSAAEVSILEDFVHLTVLGTLQPPNSSAVRKSVFWYQPNATSYSYSKAIDWSTWESWDIADAYATDRTYDYVHVSALYWALYRVARYYPELTTRASWEWYLSQSYNTVVYALNPSNTGYTSVGLMGETVWGSLLSDLKNENLTSQANILNGLMKNRALVWASEEVPYGSEMAWDSTGQEGIYYWSNYFNLTSTANKTINSVLGYMPTVSHWGWNGNARRYWDFLYAGKLERIERQIHHYGSGLNALPLLRHFQENPEDIYSLRVGYGGNMGPMTNIDQEGFASAAFHSWPDTLAWDAYSGDYGPNFLGHVLGAGTYVYEDPSLGLVAFGGEVESYENGMVVVLPKDAVRRMVYLAVFGTQVSVDAGNIEMVTYSEKTGSVEVQMAPSIASIPSMEAAKSTILRVEKMAQVGSIGNAAVVTPGLGTARGGWMVDLSNSTVSVELRF
ncbi:uncharacterized protein LY89DRAFT_711421 [Mollisia scopiformis]|uniref:Glycoside hydrolase family 43 protein n=1 Tax=Mollisia scopiformis TaxID=149040 RepID=A0A132B8K0_MOLSC|nr:uncharacterized protein LY89DRAFT_711421 [Mollisia scopiformis]KUJ08726.1 hypothetical protein LY89DRAFT_711421 [Mollisia scopiformis]